MQYDRSPKTLLLRSASEDVRELRFGEGSFGILFSLSLPDRLCISISLACIFHLARLL